MFPCIVVTVAFSSVSKQSLTLARKIVLLKQQRNMQNLGYIDFNKYKLLLAFVYLNNIQKVLWILKPVYVLNFILPDIRQKGSGIDIPN